MTPFDKFIRFLADYIMDFNFNIWWLIKGLFVVGLFLYLAFALIVIRQVGLMSKTLNGEFASFLKFFSLIHFLMVLGLFFLGLVIL